MEREVGDRHSPIWLLGDSNPEQWQDTLKTPLDPRHPARHNIWTPVLEVIQDKVFRQCRSRVDTSSLYIRNAVGDPSLKPNPASIEWEQAIEGEVGALQELALKYAPKLLLCFGAFSFEFARRALDQEPLRGYGYWGARRLGEEFRRRISQFDPAITNALPLLHRSIAGGKYLQSHECFCDQVGANYFEVVGGSIAEKLIQYRGLLPIWIE